MRHPVSVHWPLRDLRRDLREGQQRQFLISGQLLTQKSKLSDVPHLLTARALRSTSPWMGTGKLTIDLGAIQRNWQALDRQNSSETAAVVKANAYGLGVARVAKCLAEVGARRFFVAAAEEGVRLREALGPDLPIYVFSGHMAGDTVAISQAGLIPLLNSVDQMLRHFEALPQAAFGIQLDTGMNRLGMEPAEWQAVRAIAEAQNLSLVMSHLACADEPEHPMNEKQLHLFRDMTAGLSVPRSLGATGGILLGQAYHFDLCRPGIGLYGGAPFDAAEPVVTLDVPIIQVRDVLPGETVGYGNTWRAAEPRRVATIAAGYADGIIRQMSPWAKLYSGDVACPVVGRISMDLIGVDVTELDPCPDSLQLLGGHQGVDAVADHAHTIGYEILTSLGARYARRYVE